MSTEEQAKWYVIHTYSGHENKVKATIEKAVLNRGMQDLIEAVSVPVEEIAETKGGKEKIRLRKVFPGYVLIKMIVTDESWYVVRNTKGVTGFVGPNSKPVPLTQEEVSAMALESPRKAEVTFGYALGETVTVLSGPFEDFSGIITQINQDKQTAMVTINMFGRDTPLEVNFSQVGQPN